MACVPRLAPELFQVVLLASALQEHMSQNVACNRQAGILRLLCPGIGSLFMQELQHRVHVSAKLPRDLPALHAWQQE